MFSIITFYLLGALGAYAYSTYSCLDGLTTYGLYDRNINGENQAYYSALYFNVQNLRFAENTTTKPAYIIYPSSVHDIQQAVTCAVKEHLEIRVRSNGHSYEGLSFTADAPFVIIDLAHFNKVTVIPEQEIAHVQTGATLGEIYYEISNATNGVYGFSAGSCPTVGSGGHISGGGFGLLSRKYGLAADNVVNLVFIDYQGRIFTRGTMSEDLFWSLRGGGGGSFGVVVEWTIRILPVPKVITAFNKIITGYNETLDLVHQWQTIAPYAPKDLYISVHIAGVNSTTRHHRRPAEDLLVAEDIQALFHGQSLLRAEETEHLVNTMFPALQLNKADLTEMSWIDSIVYFSGLPANSSVEALLDRFNPTKAHFKAKSDYVQTPISLYGLSQAFDFLQNDPAGYILFDPYGGKMWEIAEGALPFPHRAGNLYSIQYQVIWNDTSQDAKHIRWLQDFYEVMKLHVSQNPRMAYVGYLDLDLGAAKNGTTSYNDALRWGESYFSESNFERLARTKIVVDPSNVFRNAQGIPLWV